MVFWVSDNVCDEFIEAFGTPRSPLSFWRDGTIAYSDGGVLHGLLALRSEATARVEVWFADGVLRIVWCEVESGSMTF